MIKPFSHPNYRRNKERVRGDDMPCAICGLPIKRNAHGIHAHLVNIINGGADFGAWDADANDPGFLGGYPIGPECWRKHRAELGSLEMPQ